MQVFEQLGARIERKWRDENYNEDVFPTIAAQALAETDLCRNVDPWEIIRWLFGASHIPLQADVPGSFGDPPITLYNGTRFQIDVYYWLDGTTTIHQHAFCGAFQVLAGSSIHSSHRFEVHREINEHFQVGHLSLESVELLERGAIRGIKPGKSYVHSLFHLDRPSTTICIRTHRSASGSPQYDYRRPYFAIDPFFVDALSAKLVQSASLLLRARHADAIPMIADLLSRADFQTTFGILELAYDHLGNRELENRFGLTLGDQQFQELTTVARRRHGELIDLMQVVFDEAKHQHNLIRRRGQVQSSDHRFFLALLLNVADKERVLQLVQQRFPETNPVETVLGWMEELSATKVWGSSEANVLGIENLDDNYLFALQCLLKGLSRDELKSAFVEEFSLEYAESMGDRLEELFDSIRGSMLFTSIFRKAAVPK